MTVGITVHQQAMQRHAASCPEFGRTTAARCTEQPLPKQFRVATARFQQAVKTGRFVEHVEEACFSQALTSVGRHPAEQAGGITVFPTQTP